MKRPIIIIIIISLSIILYGQVLHAADTYQWSDNLYYDYDIFNLFNQYSQYSLLDHELLLPDDDLKTFSIKAQKDLYDLAALYGRRDTDRVTHLDIPTDVKLKDSIYIDKPVTLEGEEGEKNTITFNPLPGVSVNAGFEKNQEDLKLETNTNISLNYQMNERTMIRAGYGLVSKEWWDVKKISLKEDEPEETDKPLSNEDSTAEEDLTNDEKPDEENLVEEVVYNAERSEEGRVGISYQTSDRVTISADYVENLFDDNEDFSTIFGVEYSDDGKSLKYKYKIDFGESKNTLTGLELGFKDLATFNASYKVLNPDELEDQLKESIWDFGVDLNLNDSSSLSLGYQIKNNETVNDSPELADEDKKEKNIKAQLEFRF